MLLDPDARPIIAHRGASADGPENTIEAFHLAVEQDCDAFELDVRLTRDGVPVLLHDPTLARTTDRPGAVRELTLAQVREADAGAGYLDRDGGRPWAGRGVRVPTLAEVLESFPDMPVLLEPKDRQVQWAVARLLEAMRAVHRCVIASFKPGSLQAFRDGPFYVGANRRDVLALFVRSRLGIRSRPPRCVLYAPPDRWRGRIEIPRPAFVAEARRHGRPVHVWTVDDPGRARELWDRGVSGIITNCPGRIRAAAPRRSAAPH